MKDIELPPLSKFDHPEPRTMQWSDLELYAIKSYARAAIEADRAQRVPDVDALSNFIREIDGAHRFGAGALAERICEWLASTPAPAQQEPSEAVAYLDIGAGGYMDLGTDMSDEALSLLPKGRHMLVIAGTYGVDGYTAAQHQEPPQQERKPMTEESDDDKLVDRAIEDLVMQRYGIRED